MENRKKTFVDKCMIIVEVRLTNTQLYKKSVCELFHKSWIMFWIEIYTIILNQSLFSSPNLGWKHCRLYL